MKKAFAGTALLCAALLLGACAGAPKNAAADPFFGAWAATGPNGSLPAGAEALFAFWADGSYELSTRFGGNDSRTRGAFRRERDAIVFDGRTAYKYFLDTEADALDLIAPDGARTRYSRVRFEAERAE
ncbi:MAG: hypothetical protein ACI4QA_06295 [Candidatus Spyradosoma sp.]